LRGDGEIYTNMRTTGIILIVVGLIMTVFTGFNIITRKKVVDLGSIQIDSKEKTPVYWSPITGGVLAAAGVVILVASKRKSL
jgi:energy-converting hydrogenase Eha subunit G